jgi:general secretion pathway protein I
MQKTAISNQQPATRNLQPATRNKKQGTRNQEPGTRNLHQEFGFTLLEIMVAISIIAIVLVSVYRMHAQTISMNYAVRFYATAPLLAQLKIAELETINMEDQTDDSGDFGNEFPGYRWDIVIDDVESETFGDITEDLKEIDVVVSFNNDEFTYNLRTYRFIQD